MFLLQLLNGWNSFDNVLNNKLIPSGKIHILVKHNSNTNEILLAKVPIASQYWRDSCGNEWIVRETLLILPSPRIEPIEEKWWEESYWVIWRAKRNRRNMNEKNLRKTGWELSRSKKIIEIGHVNQRKKHLHVGKRMEQEAPPMNNIDLKVLKKNGRWSR